MAQSTTISVRIEARMKARLEKLAREMRRSKSYLASDAIKSYLELNEWQIRETQAALKEAEQGDFAGDDEVRATFERWNAR
jgi:RHH-type rel operon transcriptional repressor/antitoxin RelB